MEWQKWFRKKPKLLVKKYTTFLFVQKSFKKCAVSFLFQKINLIFPIHTQNALVDFLVKVIKHYLITTKAKKSTLPKQTIHFNNNSNEYPNTNLPSKSIKSIGHENEMRPRKKPAMQWSITSLQSQQIVNCGAFTAKVNIEMYAIFSCGFS